MKKKHLLKFFVGMLMLAVMIGGLAAAADAENTEPVVLRIIETTDLHGSLFPYDFINDRESSTSLAQVYTYVEQERAKDQEVILLDNGDMLQGQPIVYYYNFEKTDSEHIQASVMNAMGYDAASVGNHDIEAGHPVYDKIVKEFDFPWLAANALDAATGNPYFEPYTIVEKGGVKVAILGLITPGIPNWLPQDIWEGLFFDDMVKTAEKWVPIIMAKENPDVMVGLFHAGVDYTYSGTADKIYNENASQLVAERVEGFDIIFTGHDHQATNVVVKSPEGNDVIIVGALNAARSVGSVEIVLDPDMWGHYNIRSITPENVMIEDFPASPAALTAFGYAKDEVMNYVSKRIGTITETISTRESFWGDNKFVDLIHSLQLDLTDADVSFAAPLSLDASIKKGPIYVRDMFNLYKYENLLYSMDMTGAEIDAFLEYSYMKWYNQMADKNDHLINFKKDADGKMIFNARYNSYDTVTRYYNYDSAAGIEYTVDVSKAPGDRVDITTMSKDGAAFDMNKHYVVAINSYRGNGGGGHLAAAGLTKEEFTTRVLSSTLADLRFYLIKEFEKRGTVVPEVDNNWKAIPELWVENGAELDFPLFYK
jgi:2',3'-cyclic-nucleotide 2'-phosphodiesterase / 3'-nucleotidase